MARECGQRVEKGSVAYPCMITISDGAPAHRGPCAANEVPASIRAREKWEHQANTEHAQAQDALRAASGGGGIPIPNSEHLWEDGAAKPHPEVQRQQDREARARREAEQWDAEDAATAAQVPCVTCGGSGTVPDLSVFGVAQGRRVPCPTCSSPSSLHPANVEVISVPTKQRNGDQPLPVISDRPFVQDMVIADIEARKQVGIQRYGTPLQAFNGRNSVLDAYEEALDLTVYLRQVRVERDAAVVLVGELMSICNGMGLSPSLAERLFEVVAKLYEALGVRPSEVSV